LAARRRLVDGALRACLPPGRSRLGQAMRYSLLGGGKRLRPIVALAAAEAAGGSTRAVLPFACALEMIHTYSLVHDDLPAMDDDDIRRGRPTCHKVYGEGLAILVGDALLTEAFGLLSSARGVPPARTLAAVTEVARAAGAGGARAARCRRRAAARAGGPRRGAHRARRRGLVAARWRRSASTACWSSAASPRAATGRNG